MILTIYCAMICVDMCAYYASGQQRFKKRRYLLPAIGGWISLHDKLNAS
ncbi:MAG: hypothetical protein WDM80_06635 [Limisphaerales bacterium]